MNTNPVARAFAKWSAMIDRVFEAYARSLGVVLKYKILTILIGFSLLGVTIAVLWPIMRKEFFPEVDAGAFEMYVRAPSGTRIEKTERIISQVEKVIEETISEEDLQLYIAELGVNADWSAAYTPNAGPMDAVIKVQLNAERLDVVAGVCSPAPTQAEQGPPVQDLRLRLRCRRAGPLGDERG